MTVTDASGRHGGSRHADFDLHGIVGVRVLDAEGADAATVRRQLGPLERPLTRDPDITVRFVDRIEDPRPMTYVGWPEGAFTADSFYLLRGRGNAPARVQLPFDAVGGPCHIVCERRAGHVPHLLAVVNVTAVAKGVLPLHASAFAYRGTGVLATGWAKGGKTETLLAFAERGASYVADEWVYLTPEAVMHGVPEPIRLWGWHVEQLPDLLARLPRPRRARLRGLGAAARGADALGARLPQGAGSASVLRRSAPVLRRQAYVQVPPAELFAATVPGLRHPLDAVFLVASHDRDNVTVEQIDGAVVAERMAASLEEERAPFLQHYRQFRFAFPRRRSPAVESVHETERTLLDRLFTGRTAYMVRHPYPLRIRDLVLPIEQVLENSGNLPAHVGKGPQE